MEELIKKTIDVLETGGIILYPTDTVWGIGCDATNAEAIEKIYKIKRRTETKSLIVLLDNSEKLSTYVKKVPDFAWDLIHSVERPLTIIYPQAQNLAHNVIAADGSIAIRITRDAFLTQLLKQFKKPIVSTSANLSGEQTPVLFSKISKEIIDAVDYIVQIKTDTLTEIKPSTIIKLKENGEYNIIRP